MAIQIDWNISQLDCKPHEDGLTDVVITAHWQCTGTDGEYTAQVYGTAGFTLQSGENFTPYQDLTLAEVLNWVFASVDKDATEANVTQQIANQINPPVVNPPVVNPPLPWAVTTIA